MSTLASERSWLLDPSLLKLVHECRRLIRSEFGVKLRLTEENLEVRLATYAGQSRSAHLSRTWDALKQQVPQLATADDGEPETRRMYRGQAIADPEPGTAPAANTAEAPPVKSKTIIYRGQVIST